MILKLLRTLDFDGDLSFKKCTLSLFFLIIILAWREVSYGKNRSSLIYGMTLGYGETIRTLCISSALSVTFVVGPSTHI